MLTLREKLFRKHKKASIILPTYNRKNFLKRSINSVLMQDYIDWELIVVDDGSADGTYQYLWQNYNQFANIKILQIKNSGPAVAMNTGAKEATGEILFFLGSDDALVNNHVSFRMKMHAKNPSTDIFHGGLKVVGDYWVMDKYNSGQKVNIYQCFAGGTFSVKKQVFDKLNGFNNLKFASDTDFIERAIKKFQITKIDLPVTYIYYRDHESSITKNISLD